IMAINAAYSFAAMREMSIARKADAKRAELAKGTEHEKTEREKERTKQIQSIASGAGRQAKYQLAKNLGDEAGQQTPAEKPETQVETEQTTLKKYESPLFWLMMIEACAAGLCFVLMSGLKALRTYAATEDNRHKPPGELPLGTVVPGQYGDWIVIEENGRHVFAPLPSEQSQAAPMSEEEREQWRIIAQRRREYGEQLRKKHAREIAEVSAEDAPEMANQPAAKPEPQVINGKDQTRKRFDSH